MDDKTGAYYLKDSKTLLFGVPKDNILSTQNDKTVALLPVKLIMKKAGLSWKDVETVAFTTTENFFKITDQANDKDELWEEFLEYVRKKKERKGVKILSFDKDKN